jgi:hypothetical protein
MASAREFLQTGWEDHNAGKLAAALAEAEKAVKVASSGSDDVHTEASELPKQAQKNVQRAKKNTALLADLLNLTAPRQTKPKLGASF